MKVVTEQEVEGIARGGLRNNKQREIGNGYVPGAKLYLYIFFYLQSISLLLFDAFIIYSAQRSPSTGI